MVALEEGVWAEVRWAVEDSEAEVGACKGNNTQGAVIPSPV